MTVFDFLSRWRRHAAPLSDEAWRSLRGRVAVVEHWPEDALARLRVVVDAFLRSKSITAAGTAVLDDELRGLIAVQACVPILNLSLAAYAEWVEIIVYPAEFITEHEEVDEAGVVHLRRRALSGESWSQGPVILSREEVEYSAQACDGFNVVIHELAHKLDMLNGDANGYPPLPREMSSATWSGVFNRAYEALCAQIEGGVDTALDPYGAECPGEFFAVVSEAFFELPNALREDYPEVYAQLVHYYRQNPAAGEH